MMMMMSCQGTSKSTLIWQSDVHSCGRFRSFLVSNDEIGKNSKQTAKDLQQELVKLAGFRLGAAVSCIKLE